MRIKAVERVVLDGLLYRGLWEGPSKVMVRSANLALGDDFMYISLSILVDRLLGDPE